MPTHPKRPNFKKFLTDNPVLRKKYESAIRAQGKATKVINAITIAADKKSK